MECCSDPKPVLTTEEVCRNCGTVRGPRWEDEVPFGQVAHTTAPIVKVDHTINRTLSEIASEYPLHHETKIHLIQAATGSKNKRETVLREYAKINPDFVHFNDGETKQKPICYEHFETAEIIRKRFYQIRLIESIRKRKGETIVSICRRLRFSRRRFYYWKNWDRMGRKEREHILDKYEDEIWRWREQGESIRGIVCLLALHYSVNVSKDTVARWLNRNQAKQHTWSATPVQIPA